MKKRVVSILLALVMCIGLLAVPAFAASGQSSFSDVGSHWAKDDIERAFAVGVINGMSYNEQTGERTFGPNGNITLEQFIAIMVRSFYSYELDACEVSTAESWSAREMAVAQEEGLMNGLDANVNVKANATRYQMASILQNILNGKLEPPTQAQLQAAQSRITDWSSVPAQYQAAVATVFHMGIINGRNNGAFDGTATMTRAEAAAVYCRMADACAIRPENGEAGGMLGDTLRTRWFDMTVHGGYTTNEFDGWVPGDGYMFVVLDVTLYSFTDDLPMFDVDFVLTSYYPVDGSYESVVEYPAITEVDGKACLLSDQQLPIEYQLNNGDSVHGILLFRVPEDCKDFSLFFVEEFENGETGDTFYVDFYVD